jgi:hypothetical protein
VAPYFPALIILACSSLFPSGGIIGSPVWGCLSLRSSLSFTESFPNPLGMHAKGSKPLAADRSVKIN